MGLRSLRIGRAVVALMLLGAAALVAGASLLSPAVAGEGAAARDVIGSSHGLKYAFEQKTITDADPAQVVNCPGGTAVTGGGTFIDTADPVHVQLTNSTPQPAGDPNQKPDEGWLSEGNPSEAQVSAPMLAYAICSDSPSKLRYASEAEFVPPGSFDIVTARCPAGTVSTGGGALTDGDLADMVLVRSIPRLSQGDPNGWSVGAHNYDGEQHSLVAYAICSKQKDKYSYKLKTVDIPDGSPGSAHAVQNCPKGRAVSGGGAEIFGSNLAGDAWLSTSSPQPAGDPNRTPKKGWIAEGISYPSDRVLDVWAICKK